VINFAPGKFEYLEQSSFQHSFCRILQIQAKEAFTGKLDLTGQMKANPNHLHICSESMRSQKIT
jgi:hypothetical protein